MNSEKEIRNFVRKSLLESFENFIKNDDKDEDDSDKSEVENEPKKNKTSKNSSKGLLVGDPLTDVEMNQLSDEQGSDGDIAPAVSVKAGSPLNSNDYTAGQKKPIFSDTTKLAPLTKTKDSTPSSEKKEGPSSKGDVSKTSNVDSHKKELPKAKNSTEKSEKEDTERILKTINHLKIKKIKRRQLEFRHYV